MVKAIKPIRRKPKQEKVIKKVGTVRVVYRSVKATLRRAFAWCRKTGNRTVFTIPMPDNRLGRLLSTQIRPPRYFRESWAELKLVQWPSRREAWRLTIAVFIFSGFFAVFTSIADYIFTNMVQKILLK